MADSQKAAKEIYEYIDSDAYASLLEDSCWQDGHPVECGHLLPRLSIDEANSIAVERIRQIIDKFVC
jgi:hypothetical protein